MKLTGYQARMLFRNFRIPVPEDFTTGDTEQVYQVESRQALQVTVGTDLSLRSAVLRVAFLNPHPSAVYQETIDALRGLHMYQINAIASEMDFPRDHWQGFVDVCMRLYRCYTESDAITVEINPLTLTGGGSLLAQNGLVLIDDNAHYRQTALEVMGDAEQESPPERFARNAGLAAVSLPGQIGCLVNGAGLAMAAMDLIEVYGIDSGIRAGTFVEVESSDTPEEMAAALNIILADVNVKAVLINIFGGLARCEDIAAGIVIACRQPIRQVPMVIRLQGTNATEGRRILENAHLPEMSVADTLSEAAFKIVATVKGAISHVHPD